MDDTVVCNAEELANESEDIAKEENIEEETEEPNEIEVIEMGENSRGNPKGNYAQKKNIAEGMMDIALLSANANQLRFVLTYNSKSLLFYFSLSLIILSLALQVFVGIALILKKTSSKRSRLFRTNQFHVIGIFTITFVNILVAGITTTGTYLKTDAN